MLTQRKIQFRAANILSEDPRKIFYTDSPVYRYCWVSNPHVNDFIEREIKQGSSVDKGVTSLSPDSKERSYEMRHISKLCKVNIIEMKNSISE